MHVPITDFAHIRLTVTDIVRSRAFYDAVFGFEVEVEAPPSDADVETRKRLTYVYGGVIYRFPGGSLGLRPVAPRGATFDEDRVGLDHLSFAVRTRGDLDDAATLLDDLGIRHGRVKDIGASYILEFRDPDDIALELTAAKRR